MKIESSETSLFKEWSAWVPIAMSLVGLAMVLVFGFLVHAPPQEDEGTPAHVWQLMMAAQIPIVLYFAVRWLVAPTLRASEYGMAAGPWAPWPKDGRRSLEARSPESRLPRNARAALTVLVVQGLAWLASLGALFLLEHR